MEVDNAENEAEMRGEEDVESDGHSGVDEDEVEDGLLPAARKNLRDELRDPYSNSDMRVPVSKAERNARVAEMEHAEERNCNGSRMYIPNSLPLYCQNETPASRVNICESNRQDSPLELYSNLRSLFSAQELILGFRSLITFHDTDPSWTGQGINRTVYYFIARNAVASAMGRSIYGRYTGPVLQQAVLHQGTPHKKYTTTSSA